MLPLNFMSTNFEYKTMSDQSVNLSCEIDLECYDYLDESEIYQPIWRPKDTDFLRNVIETEE